MNPLRLGPLFFEVSTLPPRLNLSVVLGKLVEVVPQQLLGTDVDVGPWDPGLPSRINKNMAIAGKSPSFFMRYTFQSVAFSIVFDSFWRFQYLLA